MSKSYSLLGLPQLWAYQKTLFPRPFQFVWVPKTNWRANTLEPLRTGVKPSIIWKPKIPIAQERELHLDTCANFADAPTSINLEQEQSIDCPHPHPPPQSPSPPPNPKENPPATVTDELNQADQQQPMQQNDDMDVDEEEEEDNG